MGQLTIYLDQETDRKVKAAARKSKISVSKWVHNAVTASLRDAWPVGFAELYGAIKDKSFEKPGQPKARDDIPRKTF